MKLKWLFVIIALIVCENIFSQTKLIWSDSIMKKPYLFEINKTKFQIKTNDTSDYNRWYLLQKYDAGWNTVDTFGYHRAIYLKDINYDGFFDIGLTDKWQYEVLLFNPLKNRFVHTGYFSWDIYDRNKEIVLIDTREKIYCDMEEFKRGEWTSYLFQIMDYKRIDLGEIRNSAKFIEKDTTWVTTSISVYKKKSFTDKDGDSISDDKLIENLKPVAIKDFEYEKYWKQNWQKFLSK